MSLLSINNLSVTLGSKHLLSEVSLTVNAGEIVAILGPNGAGKSTLFKAIGGEYTLDTGTIELKNKIINQWDISEKAKSMVILPQTSSLNFPFVVHEVIAMGRYPYTTGHKNNQLIIDNILQKTGIMHLKNERYTILSGGEKQRVHFARILAQLHDENEEGKSQEKLMMLDEPTSALDPACQQLILQQSKSITKNKVGILIILHDLNLAARYADRIILLKNGKIVASGLPKQVINQATISKVFSIDISILSHPKYQYPVVFVD